MEFQAMTPATQEVLQMLRQMNVSRALPDVVDSQFVDRSMDKSQGTGIASCST